MKQPICKIAYETPKGAVREFTFLGSIGNETVDSLVMQALYFGNTITLKLYTADVKRALRASDIQSPYHIWARINGKRTLVTVRWQFPEGYTKGVYQP